MTAAELALELCRLHERFLVLQRGAPEPLGPLTGGPEVWKVLEDCYAAFVAWDTSRRAEAGVESTDDRDLILDIPKQVVKYIVGLRWFDEMQGDAIREVLAPAIARHQNDRMEARMILAGEVGTVRTVADLKESFPKFMEALSRTATRPVTLAKISKKLGTSPDTLDRAVKGTGGAEIRRQLFEIMESPKRTLEFAIQLDGLGSKEEM